MEENENVNSPKAASLKPPLTPHMRDKKAIFSEARVLLSSCVDKGYAKNFFNTFYRIQVIITIHYNAIFNFVEKCEFFFTIFSYEKRVTNRGNARIPWQLMGCCK